VATNGRRAGMMGEGEEALSPLDAWFLLLIHQLGVFQKHRHHSRGNGKRYFSQLPFVEENFSYKTFTPVMQLLPSALHICLAAMLLLLVYYENCFFNVLYFF
jgi:hypothetical protein